MFLAIVFIYLTCYVSEVFSIDLGSKNSKNYGAYDAQFLNPESCKGPKSKDIANMSMTIKPNDKNEYMSTVKLNLFEPSVIDEVRIQVSTIKGNRKNLLWNYRLDKPCEHFLVAGVIETALHAKNCHVKKGNYTVVLNFSEYARTFFGTSFFYGDFHLKTTAISSRGNILCNTMTTVFMKKTSVPATKLEQ